MGLDAFRNTGIFSSTPLGSVVYVDTWAVSVIGTIPSHYELRDGTVGIGVWAFRGMGMTSVVLPNSLKIIGFEAFANNSNLNSIVMSDNLEAIHSRAFENCSRLASIVIPRSVTFIGEFVFRGCTNLTIYVGVFSQPEGWNVNWNPDNRPIVWGPPNAPHNLEATAGNEMVVLRWEAPEPCILSLEVYSYKIYREGAYIYSTSDTTFTDREGLINWVDHTYHVIATYMIDARIVESAPSNDAVAMPFTLEQPRSLNANVNENNVTLTWQAPWSAPIPLPCTVLLGYKIYRDTVFLDSLLVTELRYVDSDVPNGTHTYHVIAVYAAGEIAPISREVTVDHTVSEADMVIEIENTELVGNFPNPFNPSTTINFSLSFGEGRGEGFVIINVYNLRGQHVRTLVNGMYSAGSHSVIWNGTDDSGRNVSSGIYFYRMTTGDYSSVRRMMLLK
jgi:hypothetical protein